MIEVMEYYKLVDVMTTPATVSVLTKRKAGGRVYGHVTMEPGMAYEMPKDDPYFRSSILAATQNTEMANKKLLDDNGISYETIKPTCHCRKPYLKFKCVEVFESESD